jgi:trk system potassium uptake protein TrkH
MRITAIIRTLSLLLLIFSISLLPPIAVYGWYRQGSVYPFMISFFLTLFIGGFLWLLTRGKPAEFKSRDGFLIVVLVWGVACLVGAIPFFIYFYPHLSFTDALFESVSGLSTTGATVFDHLDEMPHSILYYRQQLTLLGGVGIVVIALSILPILGVGGMQLYMAETGGPVKTARLRPRLRQTAKALWLIYLVLVAACALGFWLAGMNLFDAIGHSFSTIATAGFSTHDASLAYYHNSWIELVAILFMILGSTNFGLHYHFFRERSLKIYWRDPEFIMYIKMLLVIILIAIFTLIIERLFKHNAPHTFIGTVFTTVTIISTTGYELFDIDNWPGFLPYLLLLFCLVGGCCGSTSGGIKVLRFLLIKRLGGRELLRLIHPQGVYSFYLGEQVLADEVLHGVVGFVAIFSVVFIIIILGLIACGLDFRTAFGSAAGTLANMGVGFGKTGVTFKSINNPAKWLLIFAMFAGRLEILTLLVLFRREYWQK